MEINRRSGSSQQAKNGFAVLFLRPLLDSYGVSKAIFSLALSLKNKGYDIIYASDNNDIFKKELIDAGIKHYTIPLHPEKKNIKNFIICFLKLGFIIKKEKIKLINSHHRWSSFISFSLSRIFNIPLVTTYHGIHHGKSRLTIWGDKIISVSKDAKRHLINYFNVSPSKITVINNGVYLPVLEKEGSADGDLLSGPLDEKRPKTILNVARLSPEKDQETLLLAVKDALAAHPEARLLIAGKGPIEEMLKAFSSRIGIAKSVDFLGEVRDMKGLYHSSDIFVLSSVTEGLPMALLEAMSFAKPVISTGAGDIPLIIKNSENGLLVPIKDHKALANAIISLLSNSNTAKKLGYRGRMTVKERFSISRYAAETEQLFIELAQRSGH